MFTQVSCNNSKKTDRRGKERTLSYVLKESKNCYVSVESNLLLFTNILTVRAHWWFPLDAMPTETKGQGRGAVGALTLRAALLTVKHVGNIPCH